LLSEIARIKIKLKETYDISVNKKVEELKEYLESTFIPDLKTVHDKNIDFINAFEKNYKAWKEKLSEESERSKIFQNTSKIYRELEIQTDNHLSTLLEEPIFEAYENLEKHLVSLTSDIEEKLTLRQKENHFSVLEKDNLFLKSSKKVKKVFFIFLRIITKPFRRNKNEYSWSRMVPLKNLYTHYLIHNLLNALLKNLEYYIESTGQIFIKILNEQRNTDIAYINQHIKIFDVEESIDFGTIFSEFIKIFDSAKADLENEFNKTIESINSEIELQHKSFLKDYSVVGTVELPKRKYNSSKIKKELSEQGQKLEKSKRNYQNFVSSVFDRIEFHQDLFWFSSLLIGGSQKLEKYAKSFINKSIRPIIDEIIKEISGAINEFGETSSINSIMKRKKSELTDALDHNLIPAILNKASRHNVAGVLTDYSKILEKNLNEFEKEYTFVKPKSLTYRLKLDQLKKFSPKDILSPIVIQKLSASTKKISVDFNNDISKLNSTIIGLGRIIEYNLDSALIKLEEEHSDKKDAIEIAVEGLSRAISKSEDYQEELTAKVEGVVGKVDEELSEVLDDLLALSNIDRLITIKIQVSKEKAIQEAKNTLQNYYFKFSKWFIIAKNKIITLFTKSKAKIAGISSKVGLSSGQVELSEAMADYLVRVTESLNKLPYVYRRLFSNEELSDERIFIGREKEIARLEKAINYWLNNQISSVMLVGEKGSGTSSLLNIVISKFDLQQKLYRKEYSETIHNEIDLLNFLKKLFQLEKVKSAEELIEILNGFEEKKIVVIENIEDFFLRVIGGFRAIKLLLEIITATNGNILWITTCNSFAWRFLRKVLNIDDYFTFNIELGSLDEKLFENIIMSRHNISGYDLEFVPSEDIKKMKSFSKLNDSEKQDYLKEEYFKQFKKLSVNNIGVALFIWLRSILEFDEESISVNTDIDLDFSFLGLLSDQKLFTLMAIILHDGLKLEQHAFSFNNDIKESQLLFSSLTDDGIIFKRNDLYKINFQLYNPIIELLKNKNILH